MISMSLSFAWKSHKPIIEIHFSFHKWSSHAAHASVLLQWVLISKLFIINIDAQLLARLFHAKYSLENKKKEEATFCDFDKPTELSSCLWWFLLFYKIWMSLFMWIDNDLHLKEQLPKRKFFMSGGSFI